MVINYDEYIKIVPKETVEFVNLALKLFDNYILKEVAIWVKDKNEEDVAIDYVESKIFAILLAVKYYQNLNDTSRIILDNCGLKEEFINKFNIEKLKETEVNYNNVFNKTANVFCRYQYYENYMYLLPERILYDVYHDGKYRFSQINCIFENNTWRDILSTEYYKCVNDMENNKKSIVEKEIYKDLSYDMINYLEKVASWFRWFRTNAKGEYNSEVIENFDDMILASLILAIYDIESKVTTFFCNLGINESRVRAFLIRGKTGSPGLPPSGATIIRQFFDKYINSGFNKEKERKNLTIENVITNIFDRDFTNSLVLEKLLYKYKLSITDFSDFENKLINFEKNYELLQRQKKLDEFYNDISNETIEFIEFVSKIHKMLQKYFDDNKINKKYVKNTDDIRFLAFFISSYFIPNDFISYFKDNGITKEKIMDKLGINIDKEEIDNIESDINLIVNNYKDIIFGYTSYRKDISINTVLYGLGNLETINSNCILKLIEDINPNLRLTNDFTNFIINYNKNQEDLRKYQLEQKFFGDMDKETINFINRVSKVYQALENSNKATQFSRDDLIQIALYSTAVNYNSEDLHFKFLSTLTTKNISNVLDINSINSHEESIDIIYNYFGKYIFGGKNKDKKKHEITINDIYTNLFNKDMNGSLALYKLLDEIDFCYDKFNNFDESFAEYEKNEYINDVKGNLNYAGYANYFYNVSKIYDCLFNIAKDGKLIYDANKYREYIKDASRLLAFLLETNNERFDKYLSLLNKRGITINNYLKYIGVNLEDFNNYQNKEINYLTLYENFSEYEDYGRCYDWSKSLINNLFKKKDNKYRYENFIKYLNVSPEIVEKEMESGEEVIIPLSQDEQLNYLATMPVSKLDYNLNSISKFGQELADHSIIIANEFVNIAIQDNDNNRVLDIKEEISKLMKKPSIFLRKMPVSEKIAHNKKILDNLTEILKENEARMIEVIEHFTYLKKLIAIYVYRLNNYIEELKYNLENFENNQNNKGQSIFEVLDSNTIKQTLNAKLGDYQTSLNISLQQYNKINLVLNNYLLNLSKTSTARNTTIPNLYIELSIRDSILLEQDSISDLNDINNLLSNIVKANNELLDKNTFKVGKNNRNAFEEKSLSESISEVLKAEHLLEQSYTDEIDIAKSYIKK